MSNFSTYLEDLIINSALKNAAFPSFGSVYVALFQDTVTINQLEDSDFTNEVVGASYTRKNIQFDAPVDGITQNSNDVIFNQATENWGTIQYAAVCVEETVGTGEILFYGLLSTPKVISINDQFKFNLGDLDITVD